MILDGLKKNLFKFYIWIGQNRSNLISEASVGFENSKTIGILYNSMHHKIPCFVVDFENDIKNMGKVVSSLCYTNKVDISSDTSSISYGDFNILGDVKNKIFAEFINHNFDYLYHLDLESNILVDYILTKSKAKCRVGSFQANRIGFYEIMINLKQDTNNNRRNDSIKLIAEQMLHFTKML